MRRYTLLHIKDKREPFVPFYRHYFFNLFKKKKSPAVNLRPGAMTPEQVKKRVEELGVGKVVEIIRIGYDGTIDDIPMIVEITNIWSDGFSGKVINVEREIIEESSQLMVYAKKGGGSIEFKFTDGDIKEIVESKDAEELSSARDISALVEILGALESGDRVLVAYYDKRHQGTVNVEGSLLEKNPEAKTFRILIERINNVELENKIERELNIESDLVIDISLV
ncbi:MAG: hypothetical protein D6748_03480 [Calditrichaeota bacterium]|nr:MAG: hypothetical protein D6748_03480 [Calditrichota bacterium]